MRVLSARVQFSQRDRFWPSDVPLLNGRQDVAAAYSFRRLRGNYAGALVRIRRSSDNAESDFGAGYAWLDWNAILAFIGAGDGFAATFYDQSGNGRDLTQSTAANQPQIILAGNGRPALLFDGSNDNMKTAAFTLNQPHSRNIVCRLLTSFGSENDIVDGNTANSSILYFHVASTSTRIYAGTELGANTTAMPVGQRGVVGMTFNGASAILEMNGAVLSSETGNTGANNPGGLTLGAVGGGASGFANIEVQELVQFNTAHTSTQLQADNAAMRAAWGF